MMNDDKSIDLARQAEAAELTSDPAVAANMLRWVMAFEMLLCGRPGREATDAEPIVMGGLSSSEGERRMLMGVGWKLNRDQVGLMFDRRNATGAPIGVDVFRIEGEMISSYPSCGVWAPAHGGRLVITARYKNAPCHHFAFKAGEALIRRDGLPYDDSGSDAVHAGFNRAGTRLRRLVASESLKMPPAGGNRTLLESHRGGRITATSLPLAA